MTVPATIDVDRLDAVTDAELLAELVASGYDELAAGFIVDVLRGREDPID